MSTIHLHQTTTLTPEQYVAGLTDFGPGRSKLFGNSADDYLKVHRRGRFAGRRHRRLGRHLGTPALRLVRSQPRRPDDDRLQHLGRRVGPHLQLHASAQRHHRHRRGGRARGQEFQGMVARLRARDHRQARSGKGVRKLRQGHRSPQQRAEAAPGRRIPSVGNTKCVQAGEPARVQRYIRDDTARRPYGGFDTAATPADDPRVGVRATSVGTKIHAR